MQPVKFYNTDIADITDLNRLSEFSQLYLETFVEALSQGKRSFLFGGVNTVVLGVILNEITIRVPAQYFAVEGRVIFIPQTDVIIPHAGATGVDYDYYVYLTLHLTDEEEVRTNVDTLSFVQTPTNRVTHRTEHAEVVIESVLAGGPQPFPPTGPGEPGPNDERLGYVKLSQFTWDGNTTPSPVQQLNAVDVVNLGSTSLPPHGGTHVTSDPIPYPDNVNRGAMPARTLPYLKNSISRVIADSASPLVISPVGQNGPPGDLNYDIYDAATAKGFSIQFGYAASSFTVVSNEFRPLFGGPTGGSPGVSPLFARADHQHITLFSTPVYVRHTAPGTALSGTSAPYTLVPTALSSVNFGPYGNVIALLQVDLWCRDPDTGNPINALQFRIVGNSGMERWVTVAAASGSDRVAQSTMVIIRLSGGGVMIQGFNVGSDSRYRIAICGTFGQG